LRESYSSVGDFSNPRPFAGDQRDEGLIIRAAGLRFASSFSRFRPAGRARCPHLAASKIEAAAEGQPALSWPGGFQIIRQVHRQRKVDVLFDCLKLFHALGAA
jgi:hypothetical protein